MPKLTDRVAQALQDHIVGSGLLPGAQLPTIATLSSTYGVSPTVVREALARLRSEGLVEVRQGSGAYVSGALRPFRIAAEPGGDASVLRVLELRLGLEAEAAALAATRASRTQLRHIRDAFKAFTVRIEADEPAMAEDLRFHRAVAEAAGNPLFAEFQTFLQQYLTDSIGVSHGRSREAGRMRAVLAEHGRILDAIAARDAEGARAAMRDHLQAGMARLRRPVRRGSP
ncbi:FadR family transcriptional regulator [Roseomonas sp. HJA6]|uniref:FadR family transcriptional regulator n=1 Tax=Roseomonas alba TaxID=2846776 RepID=A0ABS7AAN1_9PROT|nr:FadR family transcriptional regulator [Neoroseomonas alba]